MWVRASWLRPFSQQLLDDLEKAAGLLDGSKKLVTNPRVRAKLTAMGGGASDIGKAVAVGGTVAAAPVLPHGAAYNAYQNAKTDWNPRVVPQAKVGPPVYPATSKVEPMSILLCLLCDAGLVRRLK